jgi:hypothetical protein
MKYLGYVLLTILTLAIFYLMGWAIYRALDYEVIKQERVQNEYCADALRYNNEFILDNYCK